MGGGRDCAAPRGRSPRGEPPERAGAGRRAEGASTRARGGGCDAVAVAAGGTARRGSAGASKEAGMGNVDRRGRSCRQESPGDQRTAGRTGIAICAPDPARRGKPYIELRSAPIEVVGHSGRGAARRRMPATASGALASRVARARWRRRRRSPCESAFGSLLARRGGVCRPDRDGERHHRKAIVTRMGGNPRAGFRSERPTRAPVPPGLCEPKDRAGCADQCGV